MPINRGHTGGSWVFPKRSPSPRYRYVWDTQAVLTFARATDNLNLDAPFICSVYYSSPILTFIRTGERWTLRHKKDKEFYDNAWSLARKQNLSTPYGLAVASDVTYVWGSTANQVWRMMKPGSLQIPPPYGSGAGTPITIPFNKILKVQETIRDMQRSEVFIEVNNSDGSYSNLPTSEINKGSQIKLVKGSSNYRGYWNIGTSSYPSLYFLEDWSYERSSNRSSVILHGIDAWGLLENFVIPAPAEINYYRPIESNPILCTPFYLVTVLVACIGGTVVNVNASNDFMSDFPKMIINAGESASGLLKRIMSMYSDVIRFSGLTAYILHPETFDEHCYSYHASQQQGG